ncbi:MAG: competence/damage-inducible protein A [Propionibacteriaceae bacterium]|nr:competence/damage-inducible protein A [Propionibacteriaceae bacterium]
MRAYVLSIGTELVHGRLTDTNATYLAQELLQAGIELLHVIQTGDDLPRLVNVLRAAAMDADLVICTGGVGPTADDLTREAIAALIGETPEIDPELLAGIQAFFASRGMTMPAQNGKQAWLIPSAIALDNPVGTAPGWLARHDGVTIVAMPGVPREMFRMWREQALPRILTDLPPRAVSAITFKTIGIGESAAELEVADLVAIQNPTVSTYAKDDGVQVRVSALAPTMDVADRMRIETAHEVERRLGRYIYGSDDESLPGALLSMLASSGLTLSIAEHGSGGRFGTLLQSSPNASLALLGAVSFPSNPNELPPDATNLANVAIARFGMASVGLGIVVRTQPDERLVHHGTVDVAIQGVLRQSQEFALRGGFEDVQRRASLSAADLLFRALKP